MSNTNELDEMRAKLCAAIAENPEPAFPNMEWKRKGGKWVSPYHINGGVWGNRDRGGNETQTMLGDHAVADITDSNHPTETISFWFNNNRNYDYENPVEGFNELARRYGIDPIEQDPQRAAEIRRRKTETETLLAEIRADYMGAAGQNVRAYLSAPVEQGGRGYDAAKVERLADYGFGVITPRTAQRLADLTGLEIPKDVSDRWPFVILYTAKNNGSIYYAKFRTIDPTTPKTEKWRNATNERKSGAPYNYDKTAFLSNTGSRTCIVVESEVCAACATDAGIPNVIANSGSDGLTPANIQRMAKEGCKTIVALYDTDEQGVKATRTLIHQVRETNSQLSIRVARIPEYMAAKDPDELLAKYSDGSEQLKSIVAPRTADNPIGSVPAYQWEAAQAADRYNAATDEETRKEIEIELVSSVSALKELGGYIEAEKMAVEFCSLANVEFSADAVEQAAAAQDRAKALERYADRREKALKAFDAARKNNDEHAFREALEDLAEIREPKDDPELNGRPTTFEQAFAELYRDASLDIKTSYKLFTRHPTTKQITEIPLKLYANGLTYIAGGTSHGKSTFLQNIAVDLLEQGKTILYYGFEEQKRDSIFELINIYVHKHTQNAFGNLSDDGSTSAINKFMGTMDCSVFDVLSDIDQRRVADAIQGFFNAFRGVDGGSNRLYVYDDAMTSAELVDHIAEKSAIIHPDAIFIDYVQYLKSREDSKAANWEDLGEVSKDLIKINKTAGIPVVVAAQLKEKNNEKASPEQLRYTDIQGAASIAQGASAVYLIANSTKYDVKAEGEGKTAEINYFNDPVVFAQSGLFYVKLDKNRFGACPATALYQYDGAKRYIAPELKIPKTKKEREQYEF